MMKKRSMERIEREALRRDYGKEDRKNAIRLTQEMAKLYIRSGWTAKELAKVEGLSVSRIYQLLRYGRFILYVEGERNGEKPEGEHC